MHTLLVRTAIATLVIATVAEALVVRQPCISRGFTRGTIVSQSPPLAQWTNIAHARPTALRSTPSEDDETETTEGEASSEDSSEESLLDKLNSFLDTPILDANNRSDQGALAETLKEFVRDEPEIAQVTFSVVVVAIMVVLTRIVTSF